MGKISIWNSPDEEKWFEKMDNLCEKYLITQNEDSEFVEDAINSIYAELSYCLWDESFDLEYYDEEHEELVNKIKNKIFQALRKEAENNDLKILAYLCNKSEENRFKIFDNTSYDGESTAMGWIANGFSL